MDEYRGLYALATVLLLCGSCVVMTTAWYLHLKFKKWSMSKAILLSWCIAGAEYCMMIPANRIGVQYAELSPATLRGIAELAILTSFLLFNRFVLKQEVLWNHVIGFLFVLCGVLVVLAEPPYPFLGRLSDCFYGMSDQRVSDTSATCHAHELPDPRPMFRIAFPPDSHGGKWASHYVTKEFDGLDPSLGGYPTPLDVGYPFEYPAPFLGQPGGGTPFHCPLDAPATIDIGSCPRVTTRADDDLEGPGHIPAEVATSALVHAHLTCDPSLKSVFAESCRVSATDLLRLIRKIFPRAQYPDWSSYPPYSYNASGYQSYSYMADEYRSPLLGQSGAGSPHWCDADYQGWADFCPYHANGRYVHAHLIFAAVQQFLAHEHHSALCGVIWDTSDYPMTPDTSIAFPRMIRTADASLAASVGSGEEGNHSGRSSPRATTPRPSLPYEWPGPNGRQRKEVRHRFVTRLVMHSQPNTAESPQ